MKRAIEYKRYSSDKQSNYSIERQTIENKQWLDRHQVFLVDSFIDDGYSARNFDRPNLKDLLSFIKKNYQQIDYLVVSELSRFSREAGDAINTIKRIQQQFDVRIVSSRSGSIYDVNDSNSFFRMGLEFLLSNTENLKRISDIRGGIYTAKMQGKFVSNFCPFGYIKRKEGSIIHLDICPIKGPIVQYIFESYLADYPIVTIRKRIKEMGCKLKNKTAVQEIIKNPIYKGYQVVKAWNDKPEQLVKGNWPPIINEVDFNRANEKLKKPAKAKIAVNDNFPLRGVVKCWCGLPVTGAPSRSSNGNYYNYYKCNESKHLNFNSNKANEQMEQVMKYLSLPERIINATNKVANEMFDNVGKKNKLILASKKQELIAVTEKLRSIEEKFISNTLPAESYLHWQKEYNNQRIELSASIQQLSRTDEQQNLLFKNNLEKLSDLQFLYCSMKTEEKQKLISLVFDKQLYYQQGIYRTSYIMPIFSHNLLILKQKSLLYFEGILKNLDKIKLVENSHTPIEQLTSILQLIELSSIRVA